LKIINILLTLVTSLGSVMLPRVSGLLSNGDHKAVNKMHEFSFLIYNLVIFPIIAGLLIVNKDFVSFLLGKDFQEAYLAIAIMVFRMFFIGWTNIMGIQILIPYNKHREFMLSTTIPAVVSVGLNLLLISSIWLCWGLNCISFNRGFGMGYSIEFFKDIHQRCVNPSSHVKNYLSISCHVSWTLCL